MRTKILSTKLENWLFANYSYMSNEDIAQELSNKIREENQMTIDTLCRLLPNLSNAAMIAATQKKINRLQQFDGVSVDFVKKNAKRLGCPKKSHSYLSQTNRQKSIQKIIREWRQKSELVSKPFAWFRTLNKNQTYYVRFLDAQNLISFRSSLNNFNRIEGPMRGIHLFSDFYVEDLLGKISVSSFR